MGGGTPSTDIGPGLGAFVAFFALALLLWLLMRNMNGRMRRMAYTERERVSRLQERDARAQGEAPAAAGEPAATTDPGDEPVPDGDPAASPPPRGDEDEHEQPGAHDR
ncbi:MAG: hypothetical protein M3Y71_04965 [Actinomycetota bacterium]|nr:hypothetical protein [Actinomycetota bacterium]